MPGSPRTSARLIVTTLLSCGVVVVLAGCGTSSAATAPGAQAGVGSAAGSGSESSAVVDVVAGENFWGDMIGQIGGTHVHVTSVINDPNADPHEYESSAANAAALAGAQFVLLNGLGYDDFMNQLLSASPSSKRDVLSVSTILAIGGSNPNPHVWYDTARLPEVAAAISKELTALDPADAAAFNAGASKFDTSLKPITSVVDQIRAKYAGAEIAYTERVPGYLVDAAGLKLGVPTTFTQAIEDGNDPSPADTAAFDSAITGKKVKVLLYNSQVTDQETTEIKALATGNGIPIVGVTETLPPTDADFQAWQLRQAKELLTALGG